ncbi:hypothetical protein DFH06DRAFT_1148897 [Mycena polygramma]|nr:hypothetical protein DFH06DRAFT_1148897 [Mycena polygramma]
MTRLVHAYLTLSGLARSPPTDMNRTCYTSPSRCHCFARRVQLSKLEKRLVLCSSIASTALLDAVSQSCRPATSGQAAISANRRTSCRAAATPTSIASPATLGIGTVAVKYGVRCAVYPSRTRTVSTKNFVVRLRRITVKATGTAVKVSDVKPMNGVQPVIIAYQPSSAVQVDMRRTREVRDPPSTSTNAVIHATKQSVHPCLFLTFLLPPSWGQISPAGSWDHMAEMLNLGEMLSDNSPVIAQKETDVPTQ